MPRHCALCHGASYGAGWPRAGHTLFPAGLGPPFLHSAVCPPGFAALPHEPCASRLLPSHADSRSSRCPASISPACEGDGKTYVAFYDESGLGGQGSFAKTPNMLQNVDWLHAHTHAHTHVRTCTCTRTLMHTHAHMHMRFLVKVAKGRAFSGLA